MNQPLIVGIHGLNNKPGVTTLKRWWIASLTEGLRRNLADRPHLPEFQLSYWADLIHPVPYTASQDPEPYLEALGDGPMTRARRGRRGSLSALGLEAAGKILETLAQSRFLEERLDDLIAAKANDLYRYQNEPVLREAIRARLRNTLRHAQARGRPVLLIAHSMGSIIAYDVLREEPALPVSHLVTIGSPLGLGEVKLQSSREFGPPRVPDGIGNWTNLADQRDKIAALDLRLSSDYGPGARCTRIIDVPVKNGYVGPLGRENPHKIYGYLRTPEISGLIAHWLGSLSAGPS